MSIYVIGDRDTVFGLELVGCEGRAVETGDQAREALEETLRREDVELVFITAELAAKMRPQVQELEMTSVRPVVMEIPDRSGEPPGPPLRDLLRRAVGIRL